MGDMTSKYIGIDIGGTNTRIALFQTLNTPHCSIIARFPTFTSYEEQIQHITTTLENVPSIAGVGVSIGARIAKDGRSVVFGPNVQNYIGKPFAQDLADDFDCPIRLAHDTVCGLLGEKTFGSIQHDERCAYLTVSTGTGAAIHLQKAGMRLTISIEIGHQILDGNTRHCLCGQVGCLETYTGGKQLELRLGKPLIHITDPTFWETFSEKLALGLVNLAQLTKVETIAVSGGIILSHPFLLERTQLHVNEKLKGAKLTLRSALLGENAPIVGAALLLETPEETILH
ncbi:MAG: ROK family protein [Ktedonobacteraceae bacterium]